MNEFAERVREARKAAKLSQQKLAKLAGLSQTTISDIERGRNEGSRDVVSLAAALKVSAEWLMRGKQSDDVEAETVLSEFVSVYKSLNEDGRKFLRGSIMAARSSEEFRPKVEDRARKRQA